LGGGLRGDRCAKRERQRGERRNTKQGHSYLRS
jgi:hypothetical protein